MASNNTVRDSPCFGKLEDASKDRGSSWISAASISCKNFLFLSVFLYLQVALISKSMGIKTPAEDLLCMQNKQNSSHPIPKNNELWTKQILTKTNE